MKWIFLLVVFMSANILLAQSKDTMGIPAIDTAALIFTKTEVEPSVDLEQWIDHLTKNLQAPIEKAARKGMRAGTYTVQVKFLVERDGSISDVHALNDPGYGLGKAAEKVVKTGPRWTPGRVNGKVVRSYHTQPIRFVIQEI